MHKQSSLNGFGYRELYALGNILKHIGEKGWAGNIENLAISYNNHTDILIVSDNDSYIEQFDISEWGD